MKDRYHHLAHLRDFEVGLRDGIRVKRGDILGHVGKTGTKYPHLHYEVRNQRPDRWTQYIWGLSRAEVSNLYSDPEPYIDRNKGIPAPYNSTSGYGYLAQIEENGAVKGFHPGVDINHGSPLSDEGNPVFAPCDGQVVYLGTDTGKQGWGNHLWIKEDSMELMQEFDNCLIQETEESGSFALVYGGEKHIISALRAGFASLTVYARGMPFKTVNQSTWEQIPTGDDF